VLLRPPSSTNQLLKFISPFRCVNLILELPCAYVSAEQTRFHTYTQHFPRLVHLQTVSFNIFHSTLNPLVTCYITLKHLIYLQPPCHMLQRTFHMFHWHSFPISWKILAVNSDYLFLDEKYIDTPHISATAVTELTGQCQNCSLHKSNDLNTIKSDTMRNNSRNLMFHTSYVHCKSLSL